MRTKYFYLILFIFLAHYSFTQTFSLAGLNIYSSVYQSKETDLIVSTTKGSFAGHFVPINALRFTAQTIIELPDTINFFNALPAHQIPGSIIFEGASVNSPKIFGSDLSLSLFTGFFDDPSSDSLLKKELKINIPSPDFHGMPAGKIFSTETEIRGTGLAVSYTPGVSNSTFGMYGYWNSVLGDDARYKLDLRASFAGSLFYTNFFSGLSIDHSKHVLARLGLSTLFSQNDTYALYTSFGFKYFDVQKPSVEHNMYFVFEPRISWYKTDLTISFFSSPLESSETTFIGANALFSFGKLNRDKKRVGVSILSYFDSQNPGSFSPMSFSVSPFYSILLGRFIVESTVLLRPLEFSKLSKALEIHLGMKAVY